MEKTFAVYLIASKRNGTLYVGVTSNLVQRVWQHKEGLIEGFTKRYAVKKLVWFEFHDTAESAIGREKQLKRWNRAWKIELIEAGNPYWKRPLRQDRGLTTLGSRVRGNDGLRDIGT